MMAYWLFVVFLFVFCQVKAQQDTLLREVHIKDTRLYADSLVGFANQQIDATDIKQLNAYNLADAMKGFSGVFLKDYGGIGGLKTVSVRSLGAEHTAILLDGVQHTDFQTGQTDLSLFSVHHLQSIRLTQGISHQELLPARSYLQANVIHLQSLFTSAQDTITTLSGLFKTNIGSFGLVENYLTTTSHPKKYFVVGYSSWLRQAHGQYPYHYNNGLQTIRTQRENTAIRQIKQELNLKVSIAKNTYLHTLCYFQDVRRQLPGAVIDYITNSDQKLFQQETIWQNTLYHNLNPYWKVRFDAKATRNNLRYTDAFYLNTSGGIDDRFFQDEYYAALTMHYSKDRYNAGFGIDNSLNSLRSSLYNFAQPTRYATYSFISGAYQTKRWATQITGLGATIVEKSLQGYIPIRRFLLPSLAVAGRLSSSWTIKTSVRKNLRLPTFSDMYYIRVGNLSLRPETAWQYNLNLVYSRLHRHIFHKTSWEVSLFHILTNDKIVAVPTQNLFIWSIRNIGKVQTYGAEFRWEWEGFPLRHVGVFTLSGHYTFQQALDITDSHSPVYRQQIAYTPYQIFWHSLRLRSNRWLFHFNTSFTGIRYALGENIPSNALREFWLHDTGVHYQMWAKKSFKIEVSGEVSNLFSTRYAVIRSFPMPERNGRVSVVISF